MSARRNWRSGGVVAALACGVMLAAGGPATAGARPALAAGDISTVAGGVGGPARATTVSLGVCGIAFGGGHLYLAGSGTLRSVNPAGDWLTTPAGIGNVTGPLGNGVRATAAFLDACGTAVDPSGNLVVADWQDSLIRVVATGTGTFYGQAMTAGRIYTVAGTGTFGFSGDGGPATSAAIDAPMGISLDGAGNLVIPDSGNNRIRVVAVTTGTFYGRAMTAGGHLHRGRGWHVGLLR